MFMIYIFKYNLLLVCKAIFFVNVMQLFNVYFNVIIMQLFTHVYFNVMLTMTSLLIICLISDCVGGKSVCCSSLRIVDQICGAPGITIGGFVVYFSTTVFYGG